ncbi:DNA polymerase III subunit beta [Ketobacter sp.]|uniref:DNA polymerase III subunit beta n=1 Tax=Ketobacter sp. TaxID=2083498 RepID=UPI000F2D1C76|nr:DNA polymerase III subunit beta [Ketobacter sp.]RLT96037.1 MAG: DNA polymerase III subunit beta [Ketobacter sp.]
MNFTIEREKLLRPLQQVAGVVERRQTLPVLSNVLMVVDGDTLSLTGTDLEVELVAHVALDGQYEHAEITVPAKKLLDICKSLPDESTIQFTTDEQKLSVKAGRSRFSLATLPSNEFPNLEEATGNVTFSINQGYLKSVIDRTGFAMAQQDVRFYLNGMLFEVSTNLLRAVSTDGHRLALCNAEIQVEVESPVQAIVPRKGVLELSKLFADMDADVSVSLSANHIRVESADLRFTSKLIDGKFPDYERVLPKNSDKTVISDKNEMKQCFSRVSILSNEKYRGVRLRFENGSLTTVANNPEQEEAEETINVDYAGGELEIGFNVNYLLDVMNVIRSESVKLQLADSNSSALVTDANDDSAMYVVMPMRL